uniref:Uncharacterized protein n=1 Tax=Steinernema glaseri TaxID=37863 RepID=A0A1I7YIY1_9BILA
MSAVPTGNLLVSVATGFVIDLYRRYIIHSYTPMSRWGKVHSDVNAAPRDSKTISKENLRGPEPWWAMKRRQMNFRVDY